MLVANGSRRFGFCSCACSSDLVVLPSGNTVVGDGADLDAQAVIGDGLASADEDLVGTVSGWAGDESLTEGQGANAATWGVLEARGDGSGWDGGAVWDGVSDGTIVGNVDLLATWNLDVQEESAVVAVGDGGAGTGWEVMVSLYLLHSWSVGKTYLGSRQRPQLGSRRRCPFRSRSFRRWRQLESTGCQSQSGWRSDRSCRQQRAAEQLEPRRQRWRGMQ
jgi:hypothetical protein